MLTLDISSALAKAITPSFGIPESELSAMRTGVRRHIGDWLEERRKGQHGWTMNPYDRRSIERVRAAAVAARGRGIQTVLWIGIGGSGLGPRVLQEVFETAETLEWITLDTLDPSVLEQYMKIIDWTKTLIVIASKSGDTLEPMSLFFLCYEELKNALGDRAAEAVIAITDPERGALHNFCIDEGITMLPLPPDVGGRYSIFTPVGLLPLALFDADIPAFLRGAKEMDTLCQQTSLQENPAALLACMQFLLETKRDYPIRVIMPYSTRLQSLARWSQQLIAESLGKRETHSPVPMAAIGTQDQHSLLQQWMQGPRRQWHLFVVIQEKPRVYVPKTVTPGYQSIVGKTFGQLLDACYEGTARALTSVKRPHATITLTRLDSYHLGQLFFLFLAEAVLLGKLYRIDPYGQPGVELGKQITRELLSHGRSE